MTIELTPEIPLTFRIIYALGVSLVIVVIAAGVNYAAKRKQRYSDTYIPILGVAFSPIVENLFHGKFVPDMGIQAAIIVFATLLLAFLFQRLQRIASLLKISKSDVTS